MGRLYVWLILRLATIGAVSCAVYATLGVVQGLWGSYM